MMTGFCEGIAGKQKLLTSSSLQNPGDSDLFNSVLDGSLPCQGNPSSQEWYKPNTGMFPVIPSSKYEGDNGFHMLCLYKHLNQKLRSKAGESEPVSPVPQTLLVIFSAELRCSEMGPSKGLHFPRVPEQEVCSVSALRLF